MNAIEILDRVIREAEATKNQIKYEHWMPRDVVGIPMVSSTLSMAAIQLAALTEDQIIDQGKRLAATQKK